MEKEFENGLFSVWMGLKLCVLPLVLLSGLHSMSIEMATSLLIHWLHDFAHKQDSQLNSSVLMTVWRVVIEVWQDSQLNSSAFSHCSVWRVAIGKGVLLCVACKAQLLYGVLANYPNLGCQSVGSKWVHIPSRNYWWQGAGFFWGDWFPFVLQERVPDNRGIFQARSGQCYRYASSLRHDGDPLGFLCIKPSIVSYRSAKCQIFRKCVAQIGLYHYIAKYGHLGCGRKVSPPFRSIEII